MMQVEPTSVKILVVDDNPAALAGCRRILQKAGYQVIEAATGEEGVRLVRELHPDLVLMDVQLPGISGLEAVRLIKEDPELNAIFVVIISASVISSKDQAGGLEVGADGYLVRPIPNQELLARVNAFLRQKKMGDALRTSEALFANSFECAPIGMGLLTPEGRWLKVNRALCELLGYSEVELLARSFREITFPEDHETDQEQVRQLLAGETHSYQIEKRLLHLQGGLVRVLLNASLAWNAQGEPLYLIAQIQDITERKRIEEELRSKTAFLEAQANSTIDGILVLDLQWNKILQNKRTLDLFKVPRRIAEDLCFKPLLDWVIDSVKTPEVCMERFAHLRSHPDATCRDEVELKDGTILERYSAPVIGEAGHCYGRIWNFRDVTERRRAEQRAEEALRREVVLRRELHHRVKNNLQVVISLLYLQSTTVSDPAIRTLLRESQDRVRSIAIIHEMLYQREDLTSIAFGEYVRQLAVDLFLAYSVSQGDITLKVESEGVFLGINAAIPCGIIITELITNALKYAFPKGRKGGIEIAMLPDPPGKMFTMSVRDNGIGLPKTLDCKRANTMGLSLVRDLTLQMGGALEFGQGTCGNGTEVKITFPKAAL